LTASVFPRLPTDAEEVSTTSATGEKWLCFGPANDLRIFAERQFAQGEVIERTPVLVVSGEQMADMERGQLTCFCCAWGEGQALALGFAPLYRPSASPNAVLIKRIEALTIEVVALRNIAAGEQIVVDPNADGKPFWRAERPTTLEGAVYPDEPARGRDDRRARARACREAERQALAQAAACAARPDKHMSALSLILAEGVELELVLVPHGVFLVGGKEDDPELCPLDRPQHTRFLDDYFLGKYPVTVRQFSAFVQATGYRTLAEQEGTGWVHMPRQWKNVRGADWRHPCGPESDVRHKADHPVTLVAWDDAMAFCGWASRATGREVSLPSELEWEKAARGPDGRSWPWGNTPPDSAHCNYAGNVGDTTPVGHHSPQDDSPYHCADMAGNVWEWTESCLRMYPYEDDEQRGGPGGYIVRGGAFHQSRKWLHGAGRYWNHSRERLNCCGFRVRVSCKEGYGGSR
jgi:formylglycine-generating enzyme required for sulfatase activity